MASARRVAAKATKPSAGKQGSASSKAPATKSTPRPKGKPAKPSQPRKVTAAAKPASAKPRVLKPASSKTTAQPKSPSKPRSPSRPKPVAQPPPPAPPLPTSPPPPGWLPVEQPVAEEPLEWILLPEPTTTPAPGATSKPAPAARPFDAATGQWIPVAPPSSRPPAPAEAPEAYRPGVGSVLLNILLGLTIAVFAVGFVFGVVAGTALVFFPDSDLAAQSRDVSGTTAEGIALNSALNLVMFGLVPLVWVVGTRVKAHPGAWRYLKLRFQGRDWLRGLALVPLMLVAVFILSSLYTLATEGPDGFTDAAEENPAVQAILDNLSWPLALFIALSAGVGEEIFFRGLLQRRIGIAGQSVLFGLSHAAGGYIPQILFATLLGVAFGVLYKRGWSLTALIVAHFLYDFVLLSLALVFPEFG